LSVSYHSNPKLILHPACCPCLGIGERCIERPVALSAFPEDAALIQNPNKRTGLTAMADLDGDKLSDPSLKMRI